MAVSPLLTHRPDFRKYHALYCDECWALAIRRDRHLATLDIDGSDRSGTLRHIAIADRIHRMSAGYFG